ncbi:alginate O-acetyltransferase AlgX-related protein [Roseibium algae]|uniref:AlgX/AlgJ SGNH hydrolase-like domain-containing protein n=1 Tax=Roseibium algae TaxID=3123038 RepID=A0ABU8TR87_9HYPH
MPIRQFNLSAMSGSGDNPVTTTIKYLPTLFCAAMCGLGIYAFVHFWTSDAMVEHRRQPVDYEDIIKGREALALEEIYKEEFPIRDFATGLMNTISFGVFDEARKGLVKGADGWLFSDEEFTWNRESTETLNEHLKFIEETVFDLSHKGITVVAVLIPEKADIYSDNLGRIDQPAARTVYYETVRQRLLAMEHLKVPDLRARFQDAREFESVFLKADTHWTVFGAGVAAKAVAETLAGSVDLKETAYELKPQAVTAHMGDLYNFAKFSVFSPYFDQSAEQVTRLDAVAAELGLDDLFAEDSAGPEVALVGSSYSANPLWSFESQLRAVTRTDLINLAAEGEGPFKPMETFLKEERAKLPQLKVVIWELPLRYFDEPKF